MSISRLDSDSYTYELLKKGLDVSSLRSKVIANNIANVNTAGYKRDVVSFEGTLNDVSNDMESKGYTDVNQDSFGQVALSKDTSSSMRSDGNNVDIESEKVNQAANTLMYNALVTQANNKLSMTKYVINGGSGGI